MNLGRHSLVRPDSLTRATRLVRSPGADFIASDALRNLSPGLFAPHFDRLTVVLHGEALIQCVIDAGRSVNTVSEASALAAALKRMMDRYTADADADTVLAAAITDVLAQLRATYCPVSWSEELRGGGGGGYRMASLIVPRTGADEPLLAPVIAVIQAVGLCL